jgi:hypothetical protein
MRDEPNSSLIRFLSFVIGLDKNVCTWCARFYVRSKKKHNTKKRNLSAHRRARERDAIDGHAQGSFDSFA